MKLTQWLGFVALIFGAGGAWGGEAPRLAARPPLGWNSFQGYGVYLHEQAAMANLEAMARLLKPHGYEYFVVDNGWFGEYAVRPGTLFSTEKHAHDVNLNEYGFFIPSKVYFPHGFGPLVARCHELGLKFGVHLMRGIPRKAVEQNLPIKGTDLHARDIADTDPAKQCKWCLYNYRVDMAKPGAQAWYDGLMQHLADMGVDFVKYDDIVPWPDEIEAVARAIRKTGRPMMLSLSPGGKVDPAAIESFRMANMLRVTSDVWDEQRDIDLCFAAWRKWQGKEQPGFWIDMDMIPFGRLQLMSPPGGEGKAESAGAAALAGKGTTRQCRLSRAQMETFITLRALAASPLMVGGDLPTLDEVSLGLITNPEMLACNQNGVMGRLVYEKDPIETWRAEQRGAGGKGWIGVFNRGEAEAEVKLEAAVLGLKAGAPLRLKNVWDNATMNWTGENPSSLKLAPHGALFIRYEPAQ